MAYAMVLDIDARAIEGIVFVRWYARVAYEFERFVTR